MNISKERAETLGRGTRKLGTRSAYAHHVVAARNLNRMNGAHLLVYVTLAHMMDYREATGEGNPGWLKLEDILCWLPLSKSTVHRALSALLNYDLVERLGGEGHPTWYRVRVPEGFLPA